MWEAEISENMTERTSCPRKSNGHDSEDPGFRQDLREVMTEACGVGMQQ